jgi:hypothetical protein
MGRQIALTRLGGPFTITSADDHAEPEHVVGADRCA